MKLSEAILLNGVSKPQGFGSDSITSLDAPCVLGGALQCVGKQIVTQDDSAKNYGLVRHQWPWVWQSATCPVIGCRGLTGSYDFVEALWHLNDIHQWTRSRISEWVSQFEPSESPVECEALMTRHAEDEGQLCGKQCSAGKFLCDEHYIE